MTQAKTRILDGNSLAALVREEAKKQVEEYVQQCGTTIGLAVVLVGDDPASAVYVSMKEADCAQVGIRTFD
ncbi:MAG: bifunctional 5,10-methylene-tetrahydrofolate dehydrogenase/5,10-methylene-tetrahydrofolate cyclohydrolase, partial [Coriobacteriia bacterium]|nr:bifunctional 5,10-methylene-tetrahydrofolate dehydrogenase/5,10-methylene-tetrahydrofolate cyclohydrolase [Coriobacteriia bacterium]